MSTSNAWLLKCDDGLVVAVGDHEIVEYTQPQGCYAIPGAPAYCHSVFAWQEKLVPVFDLALLSGIRKTPKDLSYVCLLSYQPAPRQPLKHLALCIDTVPEKALVDDEQACEYPEEGSPLLKAVTLCCFGHGQRTVPILDLGRLCSGEFRDFARNGPGLAVGAMVADEPVQVYSGRSEK